MQNPRYWAKNSLCRACHLCQPAFNTGEYVPRRRMAFSYCVEFQTKEDEWMEVRVPLNAFVATSFGRIVKGSGSVNPQQVNSIGFLLGDKKPGPFKLEVDWIKAEAASAGKSNQIAGSP
jgi:hypothetical protein